MPPELASTRLELVQQARSRRGGFHHDAPPRQARCCTLLPARSSCSVWKALITQQDPSSKHGDGVEVGRALLASERALHALTQVSVAPWARMCNLCVTRGPAPLQVCRLLCPPSPNRPSRPAQHPCAQVMRPAGCRGCGAAAGRRCRGRCTGCAAPRPPPSWSGVVGLTRCKGHFPTTLLPVVSRRVFRKGVLEFVQRVFGLPLVGAFKLLHVSGAAAQQGRRPPATQRAPLTARMQPN